MSRKPDMKAGENTDLKHLVERLEQRHHVPHTATITMAALGLIAFGVMLVPVFGTTHLALTSATTDAATSTTPAYDAYAHVRIQGRAAVVYDLATGNVLYEKNADAQLPLASLTKLLTTYAAVSALSPASPVTITKTALAQDGDSGFTEGETFRFNDLVRLALVASSNDAAEAIAEAANQAKGENGTSLLASAAAAAGLSETYALNGTGLDVNASEAGGYGSAVDVAKLAGALLARAPAIARATIEPSITISSVTGTVHTLPNTNQQIVRMPSPLLSKTGYTDLAGGNLAVVFDSGINHPIAVVVLGSTRDGRFTDVNQLVGDTLDYFANQ